MNDISGHSQAEKSPSNVVGKFADARILPFYMELNGIRNDSRDFALTIVIKKAHTCFGASVPK